MAPFTHRQIDNLVQWSATVAILAGAILTSVALDPYNVWCFNVGTALMLTWALRVRIAAQIVVNAGLLVIYMLGTVRSLM
jgi:hypothetical protein